jgi:hypothetical protein
VTQKKLIHTLGKLINIKAGKGLGLNPARDSIPIHNALYQFAYIYIFSSGGNDGNQSPA